MASGRILRDLFQGESRLILSLLALAISASAALMASAFVVEESGYDEHSKEPIYRIAFGRSGDGSSPHARVAVVSAGLRRLIEEQFSSLISDSFMIQAPRAGVQLFRDGYRITDVSPQAANGNISGFFPISELSGSLKSLDRPGNVVLTAELARRLYGRSDVVGESITLHISGAPESMRIGAVVADAPEQSHLEFDLLYSPDTLKKHWPIAFKDLYQANNFAVYIKAPPRKRLLLERALEEHFDKLHSSNAEARIEYLLQPIEEIYLNPMPVGEFKEQGNATLVTLAGGMGFVLFVTGLLSHLNLVTSRFQVLAKTAAIKRLQGGSRRRIFFDELGKSAVLALISATATIPMILLLAGNLFPSTKAMFGVELIIGGVILTVLSAIGVVLVPSSRLANVNVRQALSGFYSYSRNSVVIRKAILGVQCSIAVMLIVIAVLLVVQLAQMLDISLGVEPEKAYVTDEFRGEELIARTESFRAQLLQKGLATSVGWIEIAPTEPFNIYAEGITLGPRRPQIEAAPFIGASRGFASALGLEFIAGNSFRFQSGAWNTDRSSGTTSVAIIVNESLITDLGADTNAIDSFIEFRVLGRPVVGRIVGIVRDFAYSPSQQESQPIIFGQGALLQGSGNLLLRNSGSSDRAEIDATLSSMLRVSSVGLQSIAALYGELFAKARTNLYIVALITGLATLQAWLAAYTLTTYIVENRKRELATRRVLGASKAAIIRLLSKQYAFVGIFALVSGTVLGAYLYDRWVGASIFSGTALFWSIFASAGLLAVIWMGVGLVGYRASRGSLRLKLSI